MLEVKISHGKGGVTSTCTASGDIIEISADVASMIGGLYSQLMYSDPKLAAIFRHNMQQLISSPNSPMWDPSASQEGVCIIQPKKSKEEN